MVPEAGVPYLMVGCLTRSSTDSMGFTMRFMVRKAARLAVYDEMMIITKNHQAPPMIRPDTDLGVGGRWRGGKKQNHSVVVVVVVVVVE